jgi:hypothetical protein
VIYVSAQRGVETYPGTFTQPLRQISTAVAESPTGGTVLVVDSGEYESFMVTKSLSVVAEASARRCSRERVPPARP